MEWCVFPVLADIDPRMRDRELQVRAVHVVQPLLVVGLGHAEHREVAPPGLDAPRPREPPETTAALCSAIPPWKKAAGASRRRGPSSSTSGGRSRGPPPARPPRARRRRRPGAPRRMPSGCRSRRPRRSCAAARRRDDGRLRRPHGEERRASRARASSARRSTGRGRRGGRGSRAPRALLGRQRRAVPLVSLLLIKESLRHDCVAGDERGPRRGKRGPDRPVDRPDVVPVHLEGVPAVRLQSARMSCGRMSRCRRRAGPGSSRGGRRGSSGRTWPRSGAPRRAGPSAARRPPCSRRSSVYGERGGRRGWGPFVGGTNPARPLRRRTSSPRTSTSQPARSRPPRERAPAPGSRSPTRSPERPAPRALRTGAAPGGSRRARSAGSNIAEAREGGVGGRRRVSVRHDHPVAVRSERIRRVAAREAPEDELEVDGRHRAPRVAGTPPASSLQDVARRAAQAPRGGRPVRRRGRPGRSPARSRTHPRLRAAAARRASIVARRSS